MAFCWEITGFARSSLTPKNPFEFPIACALNAFSCYHSLIPESAALKARGPMGVSKGGIMGKHILGAAILAIVSGFAGSVSHVQAATFTNPKFSETTVVPSGLDPTQMEIAPDGRIFVCSKAGSLRVVKNGALLAKPFLTVNTNAGGEQGLLGVTLHPKFPDSPYVYVYYTMMAERHNRVSRFTADGDTAAGNKETVVFDLNPLSDATNHNSGAIHFGNDGKLYVAVGNNASSVNSQDINTTLGKILRLNPDGGIPTDNPFLDLTTGTAKANWTTGMRNTFTFAVDRQTGRIFGCEVGDGAEEVNELIAGSNYGYGKQEGYTVPANTAGMVGTFRPAIYSWTTGGVVIAAAFYPNAGGRMFPLAFHRKFFFANYNNGDLKVTDIDDPKNVTAFGAGAGNITDIKFSPIDGSMYYLTRTGSKLMKVVYDTSVTVGVRTPLERLHEDEGWGMTLIQSGRIPWKQGAKGMDIYDMRGQLVYSLKADLQKKEWLALPSTIQNGIYFAHTLR